MACKDFVHNCSLAVWLQLHFHLSCIRQTILTYMSVILYIHVSYTCLYIQKFCSEIQDQRTTFQPVAITFTTIHQQSSSCVTTKGISETFPLHLVDSHKICIYIHTIHNTKTDTIETILWSKKKARESLRVEIGLARDYSKQSMYKQ